jgi:sulfate permease, SulP family
MPIPPLHRFHPRLLDALQHYNRARLASDMGAGITVGVVALPLAMAFAIASGVKPEQGLFTAIVAGLLISLLGGSSVQIGGPAGAFIVIVYGIHQRYGLANLLIATSLAGVLLFLLGLFRLGAVVRYVPLPIVIGFTNGIAVLLSIWLQLPVETIGTRFGGIPAALPAFALPAFTWETAKQLLIPTVTIALLGAVESLLCARVADNLLEPAYPDMTRHDPNQELMAQGAANFVAPFFGGIPATGTIARTVTNLRAGATSPVAGVVHALTVVAVVLVAAPLATHVPLAVLAVLAGILLFMAWNMGEWHEFARLRQFSTAYRTILLGTFALTVVFDLTVAVEVGLLLACGFFIYRMGTLFKVLPCPVADGTVLPPGVQVLALYGSLFFGAVGKMEALPALLLPSTRTLVLDMHRLLLIDTSGLDALHQLLRLLQRRNVALVLADVNEQPLSLMRRAGFEAVIGADRVVPTVAQALHAASG